MTNREIMVDELAKEAIGYLANQRVTVLGDIFENPELVEVEK